MKRQRDGDVERRAEGYDAAVSLVDKIQRGASREDTIDAATHVLRVLKDAEARILQLTCVVAASHPPPATVSASGLLPHQMPPSRVGQLLNEITPTPTTFQSCSAGLSGSLSKQISHVEGEFRKVRQQAEALSGIGVNHPLWDAPTVRGILERPAVDDNNVTYVRRPARQALPRWNCDTLALCLS